MVDFKDPHGIGQRIVWYVRGHLRDRVAKFTDEQIVSFWPVFVQKFNTQNPALFHTYLEKVIFPPDHEIKR